MGFGDFGKEWGFRGESRPLRERIAGASVAEGDHVHLDQGSHREGGDADGGAGRPVGIQVLGEDPVHGLEVAEVSQVDTHAQDPVQGGAGRGQDRLQVFQDAAGLRLDPPGHQRPGGRVNPDLPGGVDDAVRADRLGIGADGLGGLRSLYRLAPHASHHPRPALLRRGPPPRQPGNRGWWRPPGVGSPRPA